MVPEFAVESVINRSNAELVVIVVNNSDLVVTVDNDDFSEES